MERDAVAEERIGARTAVVCYPLIFDNEPVRESSEFRWSTHRIVQVCTCRCRVTGSDSEYLTDQTFEGGREEQDGNDSEGSQALEDMRKAPLRDAIRWH